MLKQTDYNKLKKSKSILLYVGFIENNQSNCMIYNVTMDPAEYLTSHDR